MKPFEKKKKEIAGKMKIDVTNHAREAMDSIPKSLRREGANAKGKSSITDPGKNNQSSRKMP